MRNYRRNRNNREEIQEEKPEDSTTTEEQIETLVEGLSHSELERIRQEAREKARNTRHEWRMKGRGVLACISCSFPHRTYIPMNITLTGIDTHGNPILQSIK